MIITWKKKRNKKNIIYFNDYNLEKKEKQKTDSILIIGGC